MPVQKKGGLGKGLGALFSEQNPTPARQREETAPSPAEDGNVGGVLEIDINEITPNRSQPRKVFDEEKLEELADSIRAHGMIQPIILRKIDEGYEIVAGERRWRAARLAGLRKVPCIIREYSEKDNMLVALIENLQRQDLNPMEEADAFALLAEEHGMTHEAIAESIGRGREKRSRSYVTNTLRLRELPDQIRRMIAKGQLSAGHGRALLSLDTEEARIHAAKKVLEEELSVRQTEELVRNFEMPPASPKPPARNTPAVSYRDIESDLKDALGARVRIREKNNKGSIQLSFFSREELERLIELLGSLKQ